MTGAELDSFLEHEARSDAQMLASIGLISTGEAPADYAAVGAWVFPILVGIGLIISSAGAFYERTRVGRSFPQQSDWNTIGAICAVLLFYTLSFNSIGYLLATTLFLLFITRLLSGRFTLTNVVFSVATTAAIYSLFNFALKIGLPSGLLG